MLADTHTVELTETHLKISVRSSSGSLSYSDISKIDRDSFNIYAVLYGGAVVPIPANAFSGADEIDQFVSCLKQRVAANNSLKADGEDGPKH